MRCACAVPSSSPNGDKNTLLFLHCFSWQWLRFSLTGIVYYTTTNGFSERFIREFAAAAMPIPNPRQLCSDSSDDYYTLQDFVKNSDIFFDVPKN